MIGIYAIKNLVNGKQYVGQSTGIKVRFRNHRSELNRGVHDNKHLQRAWKLYGSDSFEFVVLEETNETELSVREEFWMKQIPDGMRYNIAEDIVTRRHSAATKEKMRVVKLGKKNQFFGKQHSDETRKQMSAAKKGVYDGADNPNFGKKWSNEQKARAALSSPTAKLTKDNVLAIRNLLALKIKHQDIANQFGVSRTVITRINSGNRWATIKGE
jgi:group I intron endonuclease